MCITRSASRAAAAWARYPCPHCSPRALEAGAAAAAPRRRRRRRRRREAAEANANAFNVASAVAWRPRRRSRRSYIVLADSDRDETGAAAPGVAYVYPRPRQHSTRCATPARCRPPRGRCCSPAITPTRSTTSLSTHYQNYSATSITHEHHILRCRGGQMTYHGHMVPRPEPRAKSPENAMSTQ
jgi:hypothetical protein